MGTSTKTLVFEMANGPDSQSKTASLPLAPPFDVEYEIWASGDLPSGSAYFSATVAGQSLGNFTTGYYEIPPVTEREDAHRVTFGTLTGVADESIDVDVSVTTWVDGSPLSARIWVVFLYPSIPEEPDYYENFSYARILQQVGVSDETIYVDDVSRFPSNEILAKTHFLLSIESDLAAGAFEIVRVLSIDSVAKSLNVLRGMEGTDRQPHPSFVTIKAAVTKGMMQRVRSVKVADEIPSADTDIYFDGDVVFDAPNKFAAIFVGGEWVGFTSALTRQVAEIAALLGRTATAIATIEDTLYEPPSIQLSLMRMGQFLLDISQWEGRLLDHERSLESIFHNFVEIEDRVATTETDVDSLQEALSLDPVTAAIALGG